MSHLRTSVAPGFVAVAALTTSTFAGGGDGGGGGGGDGPFQTTWIESLPFHDTGDTTGLTDQFDVACPYSGSTAPDAWYSFSACESTWVELTLCESQYDTKVYVLDSAFNVLGCNDDACTSAGGGAFRSELLGVPVERGEKYYIVIDGWSGAAGTFDVNVSYAGVLEECVIECVGTDEGEPCADDGSELDMVNAGCDVVSGPPIFTTIECGESICSIAWESAVARDTDWYQIGAGDAPITVQGNLVSEFYGEVMVFGPDPTCDRLESMLTAPGRLLGCQSLQFDVRLAADQEAWCLVVPDTLSGTLTCDYDPSVPLPCGGFHPFGNDYAISINCLPPDCLPLGDLDGDGVVDFDDLLTLLANFGPCP